MVFMICTAKSKSLISQDLSDYWISGGDSGSCVWDMPGRIAGILTGGPTNRGVNDVTYAAPIEWILDDIRIQTGFEVELV